MNEWQLALGYQGWIIYRSLVSTPGLSRMNDISITRQIVSFIICSIRLLEKAECSLVVMQLLNTNQLCKTPETTVFRNDGEYRSVIGLVIMHALWSLHFTVLAYREKNIEVDMSSLNSASTVLSSLTYF